MCGVWPLKRQEYDYISVGTRIKTARKAKNLTQESLAESVDVGCQHISDIERGICGLSVSTLIELCRVLEVSADYLLFGRSPGGSPLDGLYAGLNPTQKKFVDDFVALYAGSVK